MQSQPGGPQALHIAAEQLLAWVRTVTLGGARAHEPDPQPPSQWDSIVRMALERIGSVGPPLEAPGGLGPDRSVSHTTAPLVGAPSPASNFVFGNILGTHPTAPGRAIRGRPNFGDQVSLNPQPLPPRWSFLIATAQIVIRRGELLQDLADGLAQAGAEHGIIIIGGYIDRFADDWCGGAQSP